MSQIRVNTIQNANGTTALTIAANGQLSSVNTAVANVTTLNANSGVLATQNGMTGIAKAWVNFNGTDGSIRSSFNIGSVTKTGTGLYTLNFTTAMPNANYACAVSTGQGFLLGNTNSDGTAPTTTAQTLRITSTSANYDTSYVYVAVFGS